jgi:hypothetical protein
VAVAAAALVAEDEPLLLDAREEHQRDRREDESGG